MTDTRIRGVCPDPVDKSPFSVPRPTKDFCTGKFLGHSFRKGTKVSFNGQTRFVQCINHYFSRPPCDFLPGRRIVTTLDLGGRDNAVPFDKVKILSF